MMWLSFEYANYAILFYRSLDTPIKMCLKCLKSFDYLVETIFPSPKCCLGLGIGIQRGSRMHLPFRPLVTFTMN